MKSFVEGSKYLLVSAKGLQVVEPFFVEHGPSLHSKVAPYSVVFMPRWVLYHSRIAFGSLHLKKMPPMPVTFFMSVLVFGCFEVTVLTAKPRQKDAATTNIEKAVFLI